MGAERWYSTCRWTSPNGHWITVWSGEAAIHSMQYMFENDSTDALILVDTRNAFNSLNRQAALHKIWVIFQQIATILVNTHRRPGRLIILGVSDIYSLQGTTQGDNLAMAFYALGTTALANTLQIISTEVRQVLLADDISGAGSLDVTTLQHGGKMLF